MCLRLSWWPGPSKDHRWMGLVRITLWYILIMTEAILACHPARSILTRWVPSQVFSFGTPVANVWKWSFFSWSWVKSPSKCFSNTEPTTIIASRDEKRCNASVQWTRSVHSSSLRLSDQHRKCHGWLLFFAVPALQPDRPAAVHPRPRKQQRAKRKRRRVSETGSSKLAGL